MQKHKKYGVKYLKHQVYSFITIWPFMRVYGLRYYWDKEYRRKCRRSFENKLNNVRYGNNWAGRKRRFTNALVVRDGPGCKNCGSRTNLTVDHIVPLFAGGENEVDNVQLLCDKCHKEKSKGESKRWPKNNTHRKQAFKAVKATRTKKARMGAVQAGNTAKVRVGLLHLRKDQIRGK